MRKLTTILLIMSLYVSPVYYNRKWYRRAYGKGGRWESLTPRMESVVFTYFPGINILVFTDNLFDSPYKKRKSNVADFLIGEEE